MASLMMHLVIADKYCKLHNIEDTLEFVSGSIAPDVLNNKEASHYVDDNIKRETYIDLIKNRVDLIKFCKVNVMANDYVKGYFLHLITDYVFYTQYMLKLNKIKLLENCDIQYVKNIVYDEYNRLNTYLIKKYPDINIEILPPECRENINLESDIFNTDDIEKVIDFCARLDLNKIFQSIKNKDLKPLNFKLDK